MLGPTIVLCGIMFWLMAIRTQLERIANALEKSNERTKGTP